jgi:3-hydroxyacyl-[acyl-carrier-protein] dehydratase
MKMSNQEIQEYHKHRYPYLLIDCIEEIVPGKSVKGYKNFTINEWLFHCTNSDAPSVPFTMQVEILTEMFLMPILVLDDNKGKITNFLGADEVEVHREIYPGDRLDIVATVDSWKRGIAKGKAEGFVDGELACSAKFKFTIPDILDNYKPKV